jgi:heme/copper-type cytochrome/quinol oxidase subunit 2
MDERRPAEIDGAGSVEEAAAIGRPPRRSAATAAATDEAAGIMLAIVIPTILATLGFAWWFRASNDARALSAELEYSGRIEMLVWSIPALTVLLLGGVAWIGSHDLDPPQADRGTTKPLEVQVVSLDWKWLFIYPDQGVASVNRWSFRRRPCISS